MILTSLLTSDSPVRHWHELEAMADSYCVHRPPGCWRRPRRRPELVEEVLVDPATPIEDGHQHHATWTLPLTSTGPDTHSTYTGDYLIELRVPAPSFEPASHRRQQHRQHQSPRPCRKGPWHNRHRRAHLHLTTTSLPKNKQSHQPPDHGRRPGAARKAPPPLPPDSDDDMPIATKAPPALH